MQCISIFQLIGNINDNVCWLSIPYFKNTRADYRGCMAEPPKLHSVLWRYRVFFHVKTPWPCMLPAFIPNICASVCKWHRAAVNNCTFGDPYIKQWRQRPDNNIVNLLIQQDNIMSFLVPPVLQDLLSSCPAPLVELHVLKSNQSMYTIRRNLLKKETIAQWKVSAVTSYCYPVLTLLMQGILKQPGEAQFFWLFRTSLGIPPGALAHFWNVFSLRSTDIRHIESQCDERCISTTERHCQAESQRPQEINWQEGILWNNKVWWRFVIDVFCKSKNCFIFYHNSNLNMTGTDKEQCDKWRIFHVFERCLSFSRM